MQQKVSVITVVFNDVAHVRETMESFFSQTWEEKEYIVVDGGSTDGTADIIKEYADRLAWWCSEPDGGIYDAMNKGIAHATGDWINILNSGDLYASKNALRDAIINTPDIERADVVYGDSIERHPVNGDVFRPACKDLDRMKDGPIYRHGSSLVRTSLQRQHLFDTAQQARFGFSLDWLMIFGLYQEGCTFQKSNSTMEIFRTEGVSNNYRQSMVYNRMITRGRDLNWKDHLAVLKAIWTDRFKQSGLYRWMVAFLTEYVLNDILPHIPCWPIRKAVMKFLKMKVGKGSFIMKKVYIMTPQQLAIGQHSHINRDCLMDARGGIAIGDNVSISHRVAMVTGSHDYNSPSFRGRFLPIKIEDYVWIGVGATILQGVRIGRGAVVCAGAVVTKDVEPYSIVAGIPARKIGKRNQDLYYHCNGATPFA